MSDFKPNGLEDLMRLVEEGDAEAQNILGARLITGYYIEKDIPGGFYWYCQAIKKGYVHAKWDAGSMLIDGDEGVEKNEALGFRLIEEAAQANENSACLFLSQCYLKGLYGKEVNIELAEYWKRRAWDTDNIKEYDDKPIDLEGEYNIVLKKPKYINFGQLILNLHLY